MLEVHASDLLTYKQCRRKWVWATRRNLEPKRPYGPFMVGRAVHLCLEKYYGTSPADRAQFSAEAVLREHRKEVDAQVGSLWKTESAYIDELFGQSLGLAEHYVLWANNSDVDKHLTFITLEQEFRIPIRAFDAKHPNGFLSRRAFLAGRFDGVVRDERDGTLWLWEIKTARSIEERVRWLPLDEQANIYCLAAQRLFGERMEGILYTLLRKKIPTSPARLASGFLSQNMSIDTTAQAYLDAIKAQHGEQATPEFIREHYGAILEDLLRRPSTYFARTGIKRTQAELEAVERNLWAVVLEMLSPTMVPYPSAGMHCNYCTFREPCIQMNLEQDYEATLATAYQQRQLRLSEAEVPAPGEA
jgi:hypothetical protein